DLLEIAAVDIQPADIGTRGDQRLLELDLLLAREPDGTAVEIDPRDARAQHQLDALRAPPVVRAEERLLPALLAAHVALVAVGSVVGRVWLAAHDKQPAGGPFLAQPAGASRRGESSADEQVVDLAVGHGRHLTAPADGGSTTWPRWEYGRQSS